MSKPDYIISAQPGYWLIEHGVRERIVAWHVSADDHDPDIFRAAPVTIMSDWDESVCFYPPGVFNYIDQDPPMISGTELPLLPSAADDLSSQRQRCGVARKNHQGAKRGAA